MNDASHKKCNQKNKCESPNIGLYLQIVPRGKPRLVARISSRITTVIRVVVSIEETIAVLPSHSQFRCTIHSYLHLHGLVLETSIYHWQDQPGSYIIQISRRNRILNNKSFRSLGLVSVSQTKMRESENDPPSWWNSSIRQSGLANNKNWVSQKKKV